MMEQFRQKKIPAQYDLGDLEEDMKNFYRKMAQ